jgi:hypothetical protein
LRELEEFLALSEDRMDEEFLRAVNFFSLSVELLQWRRGRSFITEEGNRNLPSYVWQNLKGTVGTG